MRRALTIGALTATLALTGVACSSDDGTTDQVATTTTAAEAGRKSFQVQTQDGQVSVSLDGQLPPGWPSDFPLPDGAEAAGSGSAGGSDSTGMIAVFSATGTPEEAFAFYTSQTELTVDNQSSLGTGERYLGTAALSGAFDARVTVLPKDGQTLIVVILTTSGTDTTSGPGTTSGSATATTEAA